MLNFLIRTTPRFCLLIFIRLLKSCGYYVSGLPSWGAFCFTFYKTGVIWNVNTIVLWWSLWCEQWPDRCLNMLRVLRDVLKRSWASKDVIHSVLIEHNRCRNIGIRYDVELRLIPIGLKLNLSGTWPWMTLRFQGYAAYTLLMFPCWRCYSGRLRLISRSRPTSWSLLAWVWSRSGSLPLRWLLILLRRL